MDVLDPPSRGNEAPSRSTKRLSRPSGNKTSPPTDSNMQNGMTDYGPRDLLGEERRAGTGWEGEGVNEGGRKEEEEGGWKRERARRRRVTISQEVRRRRQDGRVVLIEMTYDDGE